MDCKYKIWTLDLKNLYNEKLFKWNYYIRFYANVTIFDASQIYNRYQILISVESPIKNDLCISLIKNILYIVKLSIVSKIVNISF